MIYQRLTRQDDRDIPRILSVYRLPAVSRFISIDEANYWRYVTASDHVFFYKIFDGETPVAAMHCETDGKTLYPAIVVFPEHQRKGIAARALTDLQEGRLPLDFDRIRVSIDKSNTASLRLFESAGFVCIGREEELLEYEYAKC